MKYIAFIFTIFLCSIIQPSLSAQQKDYNFKITGKFSTDYNGNIYIGFGDVKDSTTVINGNFILNGTLQKPTQQAWLHIADNSTIVWIFLDAAEIKVELRHSSKIDNGQVLNILKLTSIEGAKAHEISEKFDDVIHAHWKGKTSDDELYKRLFDLILENPNHSGSSRAITDIIFPEQVLSIDRIDSLFSLVNISMQEPSEIDMITKGIYALKNYAKGNLFPQFNSIGPNEEIVTQHNFKSEYILIDFWASWCKPCRKKHPQLKDLYNKYDRGTLDIVSISIDRNVDKWKEALQFDKLIWQNAIDSDKLLQEELGIATIPKSYLVDQNGKIHLVNPSIDEIDRYLK